VGGAYLESENGKRNNPAGKKTEREAASRGFGDLFTGGK